MTKIQALSENSVYVEHALRHVFLSALLRAQWERDHGAKLRIYDSGVDDSGFDLVARLGRVVRHIQLKGTHTKGKARDIKAHVGLSEEDGGCVVWMAYDSETLEIPHYWFFGASAGETMEDISHLRAAMTTRRNIQGLRTARGKHRVLKRSAFTGPLSIKQLLEILFPELDSV